MSYDLAIIGAGWAGFNAAIRARDLGLKVALIEKKQIGGTCLNHGCIPTKALIQTAKSYTLIKKSGNFGIELESLPKINLAKAQERKARLIEQLRAGMQFMLKGIDIFCGEARVLSNEELNVGGQNIKTRFIIIATGSKPLELKDLKFDGKKIISSDDMLELKEAPQSLLIIGGGVIGCEFAGLYSVLGSEITIVEMMPQLLPGADRDTAKKLENIFKKKGIDIKTNTDAAKMELSNYERVLLCIGRAAMTADLGLNELGLKLERGKIVVDEQLRTNVANIYACGDCTGKSMLAHFAAYQGTIAAENIADPAHPKNADNPIIPSCIFTDPEIASVGMNEEEAINKSIDIKISKFDFLGSGMARILDEAEGFVKIISDKNTGRILGASIIGPKATELIGILTVAASAHLTISQIKDTIFAHPTLSESIHETLA